MAVDLSLVKNTALAILAAEDTTKDSPVVRRARVAQGVTVIGGCTTIGYVFGGRFGGLIGGVVGVMLNRLVKGEE